ncbi:hypothetical protein SeMB42_g06880 [Synchytrium endobioticum]|uniref:Uncharacterized protein n=1 Tax=Synchytrium endobioticum TaxID=286115 RepID=A0A507CI11_9FUNG|nr:hypothetical protein SeMB42_g06880 [Synchytrium endobioticum]TPX49517.1 hypothetical protein SeLEV6574_g01425 [Synchytrium endobioticum]
MPFLEDVEATNKEMVCAVMVLPSSSNPGSYIRTWWTLLMQFDMLAFVTWTRARFCSEAFVILSCQARFSGENSIPESHPSPSCVLDMLLQVAILLPLVSFQIHQASATDEYDSGQDSSSSPPRRFDDFFPIPHDRLVRQSPWYESSKKNRLYQLDPVIGKHSDPMRRLKTLFQDWDTKYELGRSGHLGPRVPKHYGEVARSYAQKLRDQEILQALDVFGLAIGFMDEFIEPHQFERMGTNELQRRELERVSKNVDTFDVSKPFAFSALPLCTIMLSQVYIDIVRKSSACMDTQEQLEAKADLESSSAVDRREMHSLYHSLVLKKLQLVHLHVQSLLTHYYGHTAREEEHISCPISEGLARLESTIEHHMDESLKVSSFTDSTDPYNVDLKNDERKLDFDEDGSSVGDDGAPVMDSSQWLASEDAAYSDAGMWQYSGKEEEWSSSATESVDKKEEYISHYEYHLPSNLWEDTPSSGTVHKHRSMDGYSHSTSVGGGSNARYYSDSSSSRGRFTFDRPRI